MCTRLAGLPWCRARIDVSGPQSRLLYVVTCLCGSWSAPKISTVSFWSVLPEKKTTISFCSKQTSRFSYCLHRQSLLPRTAVCSYYRYTVWCVTAAVFLYYCWCFQLFLLYCVVVHAVHVSCFVLLVPHVYDTSNVMYFGSVSSYNAGTYLALSKSNLERNALDTWID